MKANDHTRFKYPNQSPWAVPVAQTVSHPGDMQDLKVTFPAPEGIGDSFYGIPEGSDVSVSGTFSSLQSGLMFTGTFKATATGQCARCLTDISADEDVECSVFMPIVESPNAREDRLGLGSKIVERTLTEEEDDEDIYPLTGNGAFADFEDLIRDSFVQIIPSTPLCSPDCQGLCPQCGVNLNDYPDHHHEEHDDRWDILEQLKKDLEKNQK